MHEAPKVSVLNVVLAHPRLLYYEADATSDPTRAYHSNLPIKINV